MQVGPHGGGVTFHASSQLVAICIATAQWVFVGCDFSTSPDPCNPEDGVVVIVDRGVLEQNACSQDIGSDQHSSDGLSGYVDVEITNSDHFDSVEPAYDFGARLN